MDAEKLRNLTDNELQHQQQELNDQLFRLKFQMKMGQTESLNKVRGLRKDVARIQTIIREKELGLNGDKAAATEGATPAEKKAAAPAKKAGKKKAAKKKSPAKKAAAKKSSGAKARKK
ncbi:MAG TPA: 50S ribosomal protein L29 [Candidatus Limnocylindrales bacterium]|nr:50S ribosomal protein L29 [Candidatus Limnocylindrales bacterium]